MSSAERGVPSGGVDLQSDPRGISLQAFCSASARERGWGLLGWITIKIGVFLVDGVALRRTQDGRLTISYPARTDSRGRRHPIIRPADDASRIAVEARILEQLGLELRIAGEVP